MKPSMQTLLAAVEEGFARQDIRVDLGGGGQDYKYRLADGEDLLDSRQLALPGRGYPITRLQMAPRQARRAIARHLPESTRARLLDMLRRS